MTRKPPRSVYAFVGDSPGPGLFIDERARQSARQAYGSICRFLRSISSEQYKKDWRDVRTIIRPAILEIARCYWADWDHDHRLDRAKIRSDIKNFRKASATVICALRRFETDARQTINNQAVPHLRRRGLPERDGLSQLRDILLVLGRASRPIGNERNLREAETCIKNACRRSWDLWEDLFEQKFSRNYEIIPKRSLKTNKNLLEDFVKREHQFVHVILYSINNQITASKIRSALNMVAQRRPKK